MAAARAEHWVGMRDESMVGSTAGTKDEHWAAPRVLKTAEKSVALKAARRAQKKAVERASQMAVRTDESMV